MSSKGKRGVATAVILILIVIIGVIAVGAWFVKTSQAGETKANENDMFEVRRGSFEIVVPSSGELAALNQIEVKNMLDSRATITEIIDEGTQAQKGDVLVRFNDEEIRTRIEDTEDALDNDQNQLENAKANLEIKKKTRESEFAKADLQITLTELALQGWEEGEVVKRRQDLQLELKTAQMDCERQRERFDASKRLFEKDFISQDEYKQDEIRLVESETRLKQAELSIEIYEKYDYKQEREQMVSDRQQAIDERARIQTRLDAEVRSAESDVRSAENQVESRRERLDKWTEQLKHCVITAPSNGLVVYTTSLNSGGHGRGGNEDPPMVGTDVSPKKTIMVLPDISKMTAEVKVNEALSGLIERGQKATIVSDALPELTLTGEVINVGVLAQTGGWRDPNRRDYTVNILLDNTDAASGLKPSMRAKADINVGSVSDAIFVPIQSIFRQGPAAFVWVPDGRGYSQRQVAIGQASEMYVEIVEGLEPGEVVLMREPEPKEIVSTLDLKDLKIINTPPPAPPTHTAASPQTEGMVGNGESGRGRGGMGGMGGGGRPTPEQIQEMMKNMTPEQREAMQKRMESRRNRDGGGEGSPDGEKPKEEDSTDG